MTVQQLDDVAWLGRRSVWIWVVVQPLPATIEGQAQKRTLNSAVDRVIPTFHVFVTLKNSSSRLATGNMNVRKARTTLDRVFKARLHRSWTLGLLSQALQHLSHRPCPPRASVYLERPRPTKETVPEPMLGEHHRFRAKSQQ